MSLRSVLMLGIASLLVVSSAAGAADRPRAGSDDCDVRGGEGNADDTLYAEQDGQILCGYGGDDILYPWPEGGGPGFEDVTMRGGDGYDQMHSGQGDDTFLGGDGPDKVFFSRSSSEGILVDLGAGRASAKNGAAHPQHGGDDLVDIEIVSGTKLGDVLIGSGRPDVLIGKRGNDELRGLGANDQLFGGRDDDRLFGGAGYDEAYFDEADAGFTKTDQNTWVGILVDLDPPKGGPVAHGLDGRRHPSFGRDRLDAIETIWGTNGPDQLWGSGRNERFFGRGGRDTIRGRGGDDELFGDDPYHFDHAGRPNGGDQLYGDAGDDRLMGGLKNDSLDGGPGTDIASYDVATRYALDDETDRSDRVTARVVVHLETVPGTATGHGADTLRSIEGAIGGLGDDLLVGNATDNVFIGGGGADAIDARGGDDILVAGVPAAWYRDPYVGIFRRFAADDGLDEIDGGRGTDLITSAEADGADDVLDGGPAGADDIDVCRSAEPPPADAFIDCEIDEVEAIQVAGGSGAEPQGMPTIRAGDVDWILAEPESLPERYERLEFTISVVRTREVAGYNGSATTMKSIVCEPFQLLGPDKGGLTRRWPTARDRCRNSLAANWGTVWAGVFDRAADEACVAIRWSGMSSSFAVLRRERSHRDCD